MQRVLTTARLTSGSSLLRLELAQMRMSRKMVILLDKLYLQYMGKLTLALAPVGLSTTRPSAEETRSTVTQQLPQLQIELNQLVRMSGRVFVV